MTNQTGMTTDPGGNFFHPTIGRSESLNDDLTSCIWNLTLNVTICQGNSTANLSSDGSHEAPHPLWLTVLLGLLAGAISIVTICGNLIVLLSFGIERSIRQPTNYFLASLAVSDLLIGTFSMPLFTQYLLLDYWPLGPWLCDIWLSLDWTVCLTSQYTVFLITMDRFLSVKIPAKYRNWRTERKVLIMIAVTWILPTVVFFTAVIGWQYFVPEGRTVASETCEVQFMSDPLFTFMLTIGYYWITLVVMCILYAGIYKVALTLQRKSDAKHKKLQSTMELAIEHTVAKPTASNSSDSVQKTVKKSKKQSVANNKPAPAPPPVVTTTSFVKRNNSEKEEDRSSSPAFASDDENSSSQGNAQTSKTPLTSNNKPSKSSDKGFINNALQAGLAKSIKIVEAPCRTEPPDSNFLVPTPNIKSDYISEFEPSTQVTDLDVFPQESTETHRSSIPLIQNDVLKGIRFIDEKSFSNLAGENINLLDSQLSENATDEQDEGKSSPIWQRRNSLTGPNVCQVESINVRVPLATQDTFGEKADTSDAHSVPTTTDANTLNPYDIRDGSEDRGMQRLTAGGRRRRKDGGRLQTFVKSVRSRNSRRRNRRERKSKSENRARKALRTITLILGAFIVCWTPYHIMVFVVAIAGWDAVNMRFYNFTYWLCYLNSPINPFCYAFANAQFKRTFLRIFKLDWHRT